MKKIFLSLFFATACVLSYGQSVELPKGTATGTNSYSVTIANVSATLKDGIQIVVKVANTNTTTSTLKLNTLAAKSVTLNGAAVAAGDMPANVYMLYTYNASSSSWQLSKPGPSAGVSTTTVVAGTNITVNAGVNSYTVNGAPSGITVGTTTITSGTSGAIPFNSAGVYGEDATKLFWDNSNNYLGIGTNGPICVFDVTASVSANAIAHIRNTNAAAGGSGLTVRINSSDAGDYVLQTVAPNTVGNIFQVFTNGFASMGVDIPTARWQVKGTGADASTINQLNQNSASLGIFELRNHGSVSVGTTATGAAGNVIIGGISSPSGGGVTGGENTALGFQNFQGALSSYNNVAIGTQALKALTSGGNNIGIGSNAMKLATTTASSIAIGHDAFKTVTTGGYGVVAIGQSALAAATSVANSVAIGFESLSETVTGTQNTAVGDGTMRKTTSSENTAFGFRAMYNPTTADKNTAIGYYSMFGATAASGTYNTAVGYYSLQGISIGGNNTAIGGNSLYGNTTGSDNTAVGVQAISSNQTGGKNTAIGRYSLGNAGTAPNEQTAIGYEAGYGATGNYGVFIGRGSGYYETGSSKLMIDNQTRSSEADARLKALMYGTFAATVADQRLSVNAIVLPNAATTTVNASGSGTVEYAQPFGGTALKKIAIYINNATGTASYTFPVAFTYTPGIVITSTVAAAVVTALSTTAVTITGAATTGFIFLEGF